MKKMLMLVVTIGLLFGFCEATSALSCPDYKIVCQDVTCHGWYGTCWSWKHMFCVPCQDNNASVCDVHGGPKCVWFSSALTDIAVAYLCKYLHVPDRYCVVCMPPPECLRGRQ
ncbi:MAG: hypothetical protein FJ139_03010 [Deltaproteobacteria bacterium]|nr:hypothetical protein [Deltaproteobacteria bacterium]